MLITLLLWLYMSILCLAAGDLVWLAFQRLGRSPQELPLPALAFIGWAGLTNVLGYFWLFSAIGMEVHAGLFIALMGWLIHRRSYWSTRIQTITLPKSLYFWGTFLLGFLVILTRTTHLPRVADTGGYHAPMIRWISEYAVVPGLANVNYRFGFNNASFLTEAFFSLRFLTGESYHVLNGWLMLVLFGWGLKSILHKPQRMSDWLILGMGVLFLWHAHWRLASPSPDHPAQILVGLVFYLMTRQVEGSGASSERLLIVWLTLLAFTIKMSTLMALLVPVVLFVDCFRKRSYRQASLLVVVGLIPLLWWLGANLILTGYILYPTTSPLIDWFSFDWKVPTSVIEQGLINLSGGTKLSPVNGLFDFSWIPHWFASQLLPDQVLLIFLFGWPLAAMIQWKRTVQFLMQYPNWFWLLLMSFAGVIFWFINAPEFRFGMGFIVAALLIGYAPFRRPVPKLFSLGAVGFLSLALVYASFKRQFPPLVTPDFYPKASVTVYPLPPLQLYVANDDPRVVHGIKGYWSNCQDAALPCSPYYNPALSMRGATLQDGFKIQP
ncbi:hypothetical protein [Siphonobacter sp. SORGH_AS_1065]|uniref:LIC_10190 family membrane protein n=1 Tax=Siphonobacter sp. SORGH_AS_1065 TaxID=3041795 RepID=UPI00278A3F30|nr:hypothetical protein [Siphonobacter sp. SORGH_AS_1065]MDQ1087927.1 hypothetical protein [Siphonobacter sp. SORGH_AS_1065]